LWFTFLRSSSTLYIAYNRVDFLPPSLLERLRRAIARPDVARTVLDIRQNYGGEVGAVGPVLQRLRTQPAAGRPLYVITDRNTFSAAALFAAELERMTRAVFVGEPMGGSPDLYGDTSGITLPFSGIVVEVSTEYHVGGTPDDPRLTITPDIPTELSSSDYFAGRDPALTAILARPAG
jgi:C-terminal processing protease CtpA/Prc